MPQNFLACDREQSFLLPPDVREWLPEEHLAWFVIDAVGVMDTGAFYAAYREDGHGRAAYEPAMMIALLLYCWSRGVRSARRIERACLEDVACRVIAAQQRPDHATIARFVVRHERALGELFGEVLVLCADAGLATVGVLAIDGTKVAANASRDRTMDYEQLAKTIIEEQIATDAAEDELHGEARGDELPPELATSKGRREWFREAKRRLDERRADEARPIPRSRPERLKDAKRRLDEELWAEQRANEAYEAYRSRGVGRTGRRFSPGATPNPYTPPQIPEGKVNITDLDAKLVKGMRGWIQGYNAQAVCNDQHLIVAAEVMTASPDFGHLGPMLTAARRELTAAGVTKNPDVVVADAGYWHLEQINEITADGIPVLIPPDSSRRANKPKRPGWHGGAYDFMR
jgi:transposase